MTPRALALFAAAGLIFTSIASAQVKTQNLTFTWQQEDSDYPLIASWTLYWSDNPDSGFTHVLSIDHPDSLPLSRATGSFTVSGEYGSTIRKYFRLTAWSRTGSGETAPSNTVYHDFVIPPKQIGAPSSLTVTVTIQPIQ